MVFQTEVAISDSEAKPKICYDGTNCLLNILWHLPVCLVNYNNAELYLLCGKQLQNE